MNKIPTVFRRDPTDMRRLLPEINPGCEWVLNGEGVPTRKFDGTCCMFDGSEWWARREVKDGGRWPEEFQEISRDPNTGKTIGWQPIRLSSFFKWHIDALSQFPLETSWPEGTYELCGPKINGNPEGFGCHTLRLHDAADAFVIQQDELNFEGLREVVIRLRDLNHIEGIVWHHPDGRMAKLKGRDFT